MWFVSPIYFEAKVFRDGGLGALVDYNPTYHLLEIVRAPLLHGEWPAGENFAVVCVTVVVVSVIAILCGRRVEKKVIFYL